MSTPSDLNLTSFWFCRPNLPAFGMLTWSFTASVTGQVATNLEPLAVWDVTARMTAGGGYRGNVLLSSVQPEGSSFIELTGDFSAIRLSESGSSFTLFVLAELQRYLESEEVTNEGILYAVARGEAPAGARNSVGGEFQYFYQNQILDVSETEVTLQPVLVVSHGLSLTPFWEHELSEAWSLKLEGSGRRQIFVEGDLDDYWEGLGRVRLDRTYGNRSSVSVGYELRQRFYDTREQYNLAGVPEAGTHLIYRYHEIAGEWRHYWDADRQWRTTLKTGFLRNEDNGSGYFNYQRVQVSAGVRWQAEGWNAKLQGRAGWYWYPNQSVQGEERVQSVYTLDLRVERNIDAHWLVYAAASREWNMSNEPTEQYNDWMATGGIGVEL